MYACDCVCVRSLRCFAGRLCLVNVVFLCVGVFACLSVCVNVCVMEQMVFRPLCAIENSPYVTLREKYRYGGRCKRLSALIRSRSVCNSLVLQCTITPSRLHLV